MSLQEFVRGAGFAFGLLYLVILPPGAIGLIISLAGFLLVAANTRKEVFAAFCLIYGAATFGILLISVNVSRVGTPIAYILGFGLLYLGISGQRRTFKLDNWLPTLLWWTCIVLVLSFALLHGPQSKYSMLKFSSFLFFGSVAAMAYYFLCTNPKVDIMDLGLLAFSASAMYLAAILYKYPHLLPSSIFMPFSLRSGFNAKLDEYPWLNNLGYLASGAVLFTIGGFARPGIHKWRKMQAYFVIIFGIVLILAAGQRLWMIALFAAALAIPLVYGLSAKVVASVAVAVLALGFGVYYALTQENRYVVQIFQSFDQDGGMKEGLEAVGRLANYESALRRFLEKPMMGHGLGGFYIDGYSEAGDSVYPHNLVLELLSETGIIGTAIFMMPCLYLLVPGKKKGVFSSRTVSQGSLSFFVILLLVRSMISWDLRFSTELFALFGVIMACTASKQKVADDGDATLGMHGKA